MSRVHPHLVRSRRRGFTLVELMVALSGGLLMAVFVFMLASEGSKFYRREARVANATIGVMNGFQRLRADIARAAFLASPNIAADPFVCRPQPNGYAGESVTELAALTGFTLTVDGSYDDNTDDDIKGFWDRGDADDIKPDSILLAGSYASVDQFPAAEVVQTGSDSDPVWRVVLQPNSGAMARLGYRTTGGQSDEDRTALLGTVFAPGRVLRIIDKKGWHHYGIIDSVGVDASGVNRAPFIQLTDDVDLVQDSVNSTCGLQGLNRGAVVNVVNFIRYRLETLKDNSNYAAIYANAPADSFEETRTELVRTEVLPDGEAIAGTEELVTEYAVDLKFGITKLGTILPRTLTRTIEGTDTLQADASGSPHLLRAVHVRLAVRSREGDRGGDVPSALGPDSDSVPTEVGMYRVPLNAGAAPFARVRTLQADIALRNYHGARW